MRRAPQIARRRTCAATASARRARRPSPARTIAACAATGAAVPARRPRGAPVTARRSAATAPVTPASRVRRVPPTATYAAMVRAARVKRERVRRIVPSAGTVPAARWRTGRRVRRIAASRRVAATGSAPWGRARRTVRATAFMAASAVTASAPTARTARTARAIAAWWVRIGKPGAHPKKASVSRPGAGYIPRTLMSLPPPEAADMHEAPGR